MRRPGKSASVSSQHKKAKEALRRSKAWFVGQKQAFQHAMNGAPLDASLGILIRTAIEQAENDRLCAFYRVSPDGTELYHVVGMTDAYARSANGLKIGPDSLACGLAAWRKQPVITFDVEKEPRWKPWLWLAREHGCRACWSFPVETSAGKIVGSFAMYFKEPRKPTALDRGLIVSLMHSASIIISHYQETEARKQQEERQQLLLAELDHRVKNILARVAAVIKFTHKDGRQTNEMIQALDGRIQSMADAHTLLSQSHWQGVSLADLVRGQLAPYTTETNIVIGGPDIKLTAVSAQALAMVFQELVTNAVKHGSLSTPHGKVSVSWDRRNRADEVARTVIAWRETGGLPTKEPSQTSYGTNLIRNLIPHELGGIVNLVFAPDGLHCDIEIPLKEAL
jgi:two-component sensor histidine kinase